MLEPDGVLIVSLPNAVHWTARRHVLHGRFPQDDHGLFDRTHLRFFTRASGRALLAEAGFRVIAEHAIEAPLPLEAHLRLPGRVRARAVQRWPELLAFQFVFVARHAAMRNDRPPQETAEHVLP